MNLIIKKKLLAVGFAMTLFYALYYAMPLYIDSSVLSIYYPSSNVSLIFTIAALCTVIMSLFLARILRKVHNVNFALSVIVAGYISTLSIGLTDNIYLIALFFVVHFLSGVMLFNILNLFIEEFRKSDEEGSTRGIFLTILNVGILISPLIAGQIMNSYGYKYVYILSAISLLPIAYMIRHYYSHISEPVYKSIELSRAIREIRHSKNISGIMLANFVLCSFFAMMAIYTPLFLLANTDITLGQYVGIIMPFALIPFVVLPYELGYLADKKWGEKEMLIIGLIILIICSATFPFLGTSNILYISLFLFISRIGASLVESMSYTYFYKKVSVERISVITVFNNLISLAYITTPILAGLVIYITNEIKYVFVTFAVLTTISLIKISKIKDTL